MCEGGGETAEFRKEVALDGQGPHGACGGGWSRSITARTLADDLIFLISEVSKHADSFLHVTKCADLFCISQRGCVCVFPTFPPLSLSLSLTHIPLLNGFDQSVLFIVSVSLLLTFCGILLFYAFFYSLSLSWISPRWWLGEYML